VEYQGISHLSLVFSWYTHTRLKVRVYTEEIQATRGILHGIPRESVALPVFQLCLINKLQHLERKPQQAWLVFMCLLYPGRHGIGIWSVGLIEYKQLVN